jgi:hypothetical protein
MIDRQSVRNKADLDNVIDVPARAGTERWTRGIINDLTRHIQGGYQITSEQRAKWLAWLDTIRDDIGYTSLEKFKALEMFLKMEDTNIKAAEAVKKLTDIEGSGAGGNTIRVKLDFPNQRKVKNEAKPAE